MLPTAPGARRGARHAQLRAGQLARPGAARSSTRRPPRCRPWRRGCWCGPRASMASRRRTSRLARTCCARRWSSIPTATTPTSCSRCCSPTRARTAEIVEHPRGAALSRAPEDAARPRVPRLRLDVGDPLQRPRGQRRLLRSGAARVLQERRGATSPGTWRPSASCARSRPGQRRRAGRAAAARRRGAQGAAARGGSGADRRRGRRDRLEGAQGRARWPPATSTGCARSSPRTRVYQEFARRATRRRPRRPPRPSRPPRRAAAPSRRAAAGREVAAEPRREPPHARAGRRSWRRAPSRSPPPEGEAVPEAAEPRAGSRPAPAARAGRRGALRREPRRPVEPAGAGAPVVEAAPRPPQRAEAGSGERRPGARARRAGRRRHRAALRRRGSRRGRVARQGHRGLAQGGAGGHDAAHAAARAGARLPQGRAAGTRSSRCSRRRPRRSRASTPDDKVAAPASRWSRSTATSCSLDVMVINTFNQILQLQPGRPSTALDALAAQYEKMKRWPDLIGVLQKKADARRPTERADDKVDAPAACASPASSSRSSPTRPRPSRPSSRSSSSTRRNAEALAYLKAMYEKRRDWEKLIAHPPARRSISLADATQKGAARCSRWPSSPPRSSSGRQISIDLWAQGARATTRDTPRPWPSSRSSTSARRSGTSSPSVLRAPGRAGRRRRRRRSPCCRSSASSTPTRSRTTDGAIDGVARPARGRPGEPARPGRAEEALPAAQELGRARGVLRRAGKWDEFIRVLERQVESRTTRPRSPSTSEIAGSTANAARSPTAPCAPTRSVLSSTPQNLEAAEALIPLYEAVSDVKKLAEVLEIQLGHTEDATSAPGAHAAPRGAQRAEAARQGAAFGWYLKAFEEDPRGRVGARARSSGWPERRAGGFQELVAGLRGGLRQARRRPGGRCRSDLTVARVYEEELARGRRGARAPTSRSSSSSSRTRRPSLALERLYFKTRGSGRSSSASTTRSSS